MLQHDRSPNPPPPKPDISAIAPLTCTVNGRERTFPLSFIDPERLRDLRRAAQLLDRRGGMETTPVDVTTSLVQMTFVGLDDSARALGRAREVRGHLLRLGRSAAPGELPGGCELALEFRACGPHQLVASVYVERADAFEVVEPAARAIGPELARLSTMPAPPHFAIGAAEHRRVRVLGRVGMKMACAGLAPVPRDRAAATRVRRALERALARHVHDRHTPDLAVEHNARVLSGLVAASAVFGAAADFMHSEGEMHSARFGGHEPLVRWERRDAELVADLQVPVGLQRAPGVLNAELIEAACDVAEIDGTRALELACASVGLCASVAGLHGDLRAAVRACSPVRALDCASPEASRRIASAER